MKRLFRSLWKNNVDNGSIKVTLETKCWEKDWEMILCTDRLQMLSQNNHFPFAERVLMINNVQDYRRVCAYAERAIQRGWITDYIVVKDYATQALEYFELSTDSLGEGYFYSIAELVSIFLCKTDYLLHYAGDTMPQVRNRWLSEIRRHIRGNWVSKAIRYIDSEPRVKVANLTWNGNYRAARDESVFVSEDFYVGFGFSDQCYLIRVDDFRAPIYNEMHPASRRYPHYGGESFEKRVDSWMRNYGHLRATFKYQ